MVKTSDSSRPNKLCSEHPKQAIKFYCLDCKVKHCPQCVEAHKSHNFKYLQVFMKELVTPWQQLQR
jgi:hypothetical protein